MLELTFNDLGIPFPLFEAPASEARGYKGRGRCSLCHKEGVHCFELGIGGDVLVHCPVDPVGVSRKDQTLAPMLDPPWHTTKFVITYG